MHTFQFVYSMYHSIVFSKHWLEYWYNDRTKTMLLNYINCIRSIWLRYNNTFLFCLLIWRHNNNMSFSAKDADNDKESGTNCAYYHRGGWWWKDCEYPWLTTPHGSDRLKSRGSSMYTSIFWYPQDKTSVKMMLS